jgi:HTH-type transcriptional regulator, competence development regulator
MAERPTFHAELGEYFVGLRQRRELGQRQAAEIADRRNITALSRQVLLRLEQGKTKNPEPEVLKAIADLYGVTYDELVIRCVEAQYGVEMRPAKPGEPKPETKAQPELTEEDQILIGFRRLAAKHGRTTQFMKLVEATAEALLDAMTTQRAKERIAGSPTRSARVLPIRPRKPKKK